MGAIGERTDTEVVIMFYGTRSKRQLSLLIAFALSAGGGAAVF